jgi:hypothetical protein
VEDNWESSVQAKKDKTRRNRKDVVLKNISISLRQDYTKQISLFIHISWPGKKKLRKSSWKLDRQILFCSLFCSKQHQNKKEKERIKKTKNKDFTMEVSK